MTAAPVACDLRGVEEGLFVFETASLANSRTPGTPLDGPWGSRWTPKSSKLYEKVVVSGETNDRGVPSIF